MSHIDDLVIKQDGINISYVKPGYELETFELISTSGIYSVKVPLRQADCIYTTKFTKLEDARRFIDYHLQTFWTTS
jgi:hypothetical protein